MTMARYRGLPGAGEGRWELVGSMVGGGGGGGCWGGGGGVASPPATTSPPLAPSFHEKFICICSVFFRNLGYLMVLWTSLRVFSLSIFFKSSFAVILWNLVDITHNFLLYRKVAWKLGFVITDFTRLKSVFTWIRLIIWTLFFLVINIAILVRNFK